MRNTFFRISILMFSLIMYTSVNSQSLNQILNSKTSIEIKIDKINVFSKSFSSTNLDSAIICAEAIDSLAKYSKSYAIKSESKANLALLYSFFPSKSIKAAYDNLEICIESKDCKLISNSYLILSRVNWFIRNDEKVFSFWNKALTEAKKCKDKETLLNVYEQGSEHYYNTGEYKKSKELTQLMAKINPALLKESYYYASIGDLYRALDQLDSADFFYKKALLITENSTDTLQLIHLYYNYSLIPRAQGKFEVAIDYCKRGIKLAEKTNNIYSINTGKYQLVDTYWDKKDFVNAKKYQEELNLYYDQTKKYLSQMSGYRKLADINAKLGNYKESYKLLEWTLFIYEDYNNSNEKSKLNKVEEDNLKKQKQIEIDHANKEKEAEKRIKNISLVSLSIAIVLIFGIIFSLFKISKSKKIISRQQKQTEEQKHLIEEKQKEIIESITYAKRLQEAILPPPEFLNKYLPNNFVLYLPKDIVAGDFYWCEHVNNLTFIAAADSTGHGVPGAMVSVVCSNALNRSLKEFHLTETGKILDKTRELVLETFEKSTSEVKDGMDISLLCINNKTKQVFWSGANNPLWYTRPSSKDGSQTELVEVKANKQPIGKTENPTPFTTHEIEYKENTTFFLYTDGFADQFGGPNGKKFKYKPMAELLLRNHLISNTEQHKELYKSFENWKGNLEQVDDVCIIGINI